MNQEIPEGYHLVTLKAGRAGDGLTKTTYDDDRIFSWTSGDAISVLFNNGALNKFFTFTTTGTGSSATFSGLVEDGYDNEGAIDSGTKWALFPASNNHVYTSDTDIKFYMAESDNGDLCNIPMIAQNAGSQYEFHHMSGAIKFTFRGLPANQNVKLTLNMSWGERYTSGLFNVQKLGEGVSNAIIRSDKHEDGALRTRYVTATANASGKVSIYMPLPMSGSLSLSDTRSEYWTTFYFDLLNANTNATILEIHPTGSQYFYLYKGKVTAVAPKRIGGSEPLGGITIDGSFSDWEDHTERYMGNTLGEVKATADRNYLYIYQKFINSNFTYDNWGNYQYVYVDTDNDSGSGCTDDSVFSKGAEKRWKFFVYFNHSSWPYYYKPDESTPFASWSSGWSGTTLTGFTESTMYKAVKSANNLELEYCIPLSALGITPNPSTTKDFAIGLDTHLKDGSGSTVYPYTNRLTITIPAPADPSPAPVSPIIYTEATVDYDNPERGLYNQSSFYFDGSSIPSLSISASHTEPLELVLFYLTGYKSTYTLPDDVLTAIGTVFSNLRSAGKKAIVRFGYTSDHGEGDKPWDANVTNMRHHIAQVKSILTANEDIIYVVQAGFIGTYGEWYYTGSGLTTDDFYYSVVGETLNHYANRAQIIDDLLDATPSSRQVAIRTPFYKRYYFTETSGTGVNAWTAISDLAMDNANKRLSFFNDAFLANNDTDTGTFNSTYDWAMWEGQSPYLITGGETAYQDADPIDSYSGKTTALYRIGKEHISYLNKNPENKIMKAWIDGGNLNEIKMALGYRLVATQASISYTTTTSGSAVDYSISIKNNGSVRVIYPRPCKLVYIHLGTPTVVVDNLGDVRSLIPGADASTFSGSFDLPNNAEAGDKIAIWIPDNAAGLQSNPAYSIRLSNSDISWEGGYNVIYTF